MTVNKLYMLVKRALRLPNEMLSVLDHDGSWKLCPPTDIVIEHLINNCSKCEAEKIRLQLSQPFFQRTYNKGRINPLYFYYLDPTSLLKGQEFQGESLFRVEMLITGRRQFANVEFVEGRIFSVELPQQIKFYEGKTISFGAVTKGKSSQSHTRVIDRSEHGSNPEES